jgi:pterin-4a-carbinolamine dehydratase
MALSDDEIDELLAAHPRWARSGGSLARRLDFRDFREAARFVGRLAERVPARDPYPEVRLHGFNSVTLTLAHENRAGMSVADVRLVEVLDALVDEPAMDVPAPPATAAAGTETLSSGVVAEDAAASAAAGTLPPATPPPAAEPAAEPAPGRPNAVGAAVAGWTGGPGPAPGPQGLRRLLPSVAVALAGAAAGALIADRRHRRRARRWHSLGLRG